MKPIGRIGSVNYMESIIQALSNGYNFDQYLLIVSSTLLVHLWIFYRYLLIVSYTHFYSVHLRSFATDVVDPKITITNTNP